MSSDEVGPSGLTDQEMVTYKLAWARELVRYLETEGPDKIVMMKMEDGRSNLVFVTFDFSVSGDALARVDEVARSLGMDVNKG